MEEHGPRRKLTTILSADCAGYSRMMRADEEGTFRLLQDCRQSIAKIIASHEGRIFGSAGDSIVAEFPSPVEAVRSAAEIQRDIEGHMAAFPDDRRMQFRIGVNLGDVLVEKDDLLGDGVNVAARLQGLADPGGVCISGSVHEQVRTKLSLDWDDLGEQAVKNITEPMRVYRMRKDLSPAHRPQAAKFLATRRLGFAAAGILAALCLGTLGILLIGRNPLLPQCAHASIAVLPFANLSGDPAQDYFSDGTSEDIIAALGRFSDLSVIARVAVQKYKGKPIQPGELSRDLGVCYALEGSLRKNGDEVLVAAQLVDALSGRILWSDNYDENLKDLFGVRNQITESVVERLAIKLQDIETRRALKKPTDSLDAYDYVLRGRENIAKNTRSANAQARNMFQQALGLDPTYASAYAALGITYLTEAVFGWTEFRGDALQRAKELAQKAIELDADNAEAHRLLSEVYFNQGKFDLAIAEDDRTITLNPSDAESYYARGGILVFLGEPQEALKSFEIAKRLNPNGGASRLESVGWAYYLEQRYDEAVTAFRAGIPTNPDDYYIYAGLAAAYAQLGRKDEAAQAVDDLGRVWPFFTIESFVVQFQGDTYRALIADGLRKAGLK